MDRLPEADRRALLRLAREAIAERLRPDASGERVLRELELTPGLERRSGVFVTLQVPAPQSPTGEALRGCIGVLEASRPLYLEVLATAPRAAFEDPRFAPLTADELELVRISLSVLGASQPLGDWQEIVLGRDGVRLRRGTHHAVFLPHVAPEQGWDRRRLLQQLALKAGLGRDDWRSAELSVFRAEQFGEQAAP